MRALATRAGYDLVPRNYYSPLPEVDHLADALWDAPSALAGIDLDLELQFAYVERDLGPFVAEFAPPRRPVPGVAFHLDNGTYGPVDAELLYAIVRELRPRRVLELGTGASTHVVHESLERNRAEGAPATHVACDPYPWSATSFAPVEEVELRRVGATELTTADVAELRSGDVLFVDTTHTVKTGGEVNHIVLELLPALNHGVVVHFHDIFLPWEYPREWVLDERRAWAEQYLLQAFLAFNSEFSPLIAAQALARADPERLRRSVPSLSPGDSPGAFWIRRGGEPRGSRLAGEDGD